MSDHAAERTYKGHVNGVPSLRQWEGEFGRLARRTGRLRFQRPRARGAPAQHGRIFIQKEVLTQNAKNFPQESAYDASRLFCKFECGPPSSWHFITCDRQNDACLQGVVAFSVRLSVQSIYILQCHVPCGVTFIFDARRIGLGSLNFLLQCDEN